MRSKIALGALTLLSACLAEPAVITTSETDTSLSASTGARRRETLAAGTAHACMIESGAVYCWGYGEHGQRGDGTDVDDYRSGTPRRVVGLGNQLSLTAGELHTCALAADGSVSCWGDNSAGQLGNPDAGAASSTPQRVYTSSYWGGTNPLAHIVQIAAGPSSTCALDASGSVWCWGVSYDPSVSHRDTAHLLPSVNALQVTGRCFLLSDHTVACWQYGSDVPQRVPFLTNAVAISSSEETDCAIVSGGTVKCWGHDSFGELGNGTDTSQYNEEDNLYRWLVTDVLSPDGRTNLSRVAALGHGPSAYTMCAITSGGAAYCWGQNESAQTGSGTRSATADLPLPLGSLGGATAVEIALGLDFGCARNGAGALYCWGYNGYGQFGNGQIDNHPALSPIRITQAH
jgi:alpha-tubulin suppressor-like RCC1 family protein